MALNPAKQEERLNSPVERASNLNDPQFENQQGYFPYDLTHQEFISPRFGELTPSMHLDTVPGDRIVVHDNTKLILNQINGNLLNNFNQYVDSFYVPLRNVFPNNYEKLIPNPVKGDDLPNSALPTVPFLAYLKDFYRNEEVEVTVYDGASDDEFSFMLSDIADAILDTSTGQRIYDFNYLEQSYFLGRLTLLATVLSRGQLLDYLGFQLDGNKLNSILSSDLQHAIDVYFTELAKYKLEAKDNGVDDLIRAVPFNEQLTSNDFSITGWTDYHPTTLSEFRSIVSDTFESGKFLMLEINMDGGYVNDAPLALAIHNLVSILDSILMGYNVNRSYTALEQFDSLSNVNTESHINIGKILAYQQIVAQYYTNDHVDNVYSSELFMQNLRSVMYPTSGLSSKEPTFEMNGVNYEYDYISYGGFWASLMSNQVQNGYINRQYVWATLMLLMRRSLRYGDYFSTARVNMLAVSDQLSIAVNGNSVSPIDVTKNLLLQRYLNAANYIGQGFLQYMSSMYGIKPSDTGCVPRFISHRKIELQNQITNNTAENQGAQTTNIVGYSDMSAFDVFIDDFGYLFSIQSFDVLPIYKSGIENTYHFVDRFDYFNPMMQGIGDQPIRSSELLGFPELYGDVFGYTMRNSEYKYKISKAHGAFCNALPGYLMSYPVYAFNENIDEYDININPDFIRDKPSYLDQLIPTMTGVSPADYFHFIVSCTNQVQCARKIQATPGVLF